jgi:hypothetical protein
VKHRILQCTIVIVVALMAMVPFVACTCVPDVPEPYEQSFEIRQSDGVSASGTVTFTKDGNVIGGPYNVHCPDPGYHSYYVFTLPEQPNDISWEITIVWSQVPDEWGYLPAEVWHEENQPWPGEYVKEHNSSSVNFSA